MKKETGEGYLPPSPARIAENPPLLLVATVAHGRSLLAGVLLVAGFAVRVVSVLENDYLLLGLFLVASKALLFLACRVLMMAFLAGLRPLLRVRLGVEDDRRLDLLDLMEGHFPCRRLRAYDEASGEHRSG